MFGSVYQFDTPTPNGMHPLSRKEGDNVKATTLELEFSRILSILPIQGLKTQC